ncbi:hypothetical protein [Kitasatospora purpeofusca]|uniref:Uncharacterized protein n=1 Tax=Kitasatospora purpeofusca TaxID=67352 RepID=A0ABZ1TXR7_9ACTN|nr:hypothetical protein [Kitasatospora purpeofusca]
MTRRRILAVLALTAAALGGWVTGQTYNEPPATETAQVTAFNDGWTDAMQDACDQGSAYACNWLSTSAN